MAGGTLSEWERVRDSAKAVRDWVNTEDENGKLVNQAKTKITDDCRKSYESRLRKIEERRANGEIRPDVFSSSKGTFRNEILALRYSYRNMVKAHMTRCFQLERESEFTKAIGELKRAKFYKEQLEKWEGAISQRKEQGGFIKRQSKKAQLKELQDGWRSDFVTGIKNENLKLTAAILAATGARPAELMKGVKIDIETINGREALVFTVKNAKQTRNPWRELAVIPESAIHQILKQHAGKEITPKYTNAHGISHAIRRQGMVQGMPKGFSAYVFRHAFGSDLKAEFGENDEWVSIAMGHTDGRSAERYGGKQYGSKGVELLRAKNAIGGLVTPAKTIFATKSNPRASQPQMR